MENVNNKKKTIVLTIIGLITLISLVVGATFAFYTMTTNDKTNPTNVSGNTEGLGQAILTNPTPKLHLKLSAVDMNSANKGKIYYATNDINKNYDTEETKRSIAIASVGGGLEDTKNQCESTLTIEIDGSMKDVLTNGDGKIVLTPTSGIEIETTEIDLKDLGDKTSITLPVVYKITGSNEEKIEAIMLINNRETDQLNLAGKQININITNSSFKCEVVKDFSDVPIINKFYINEEDTENKVTEEETITLNLKWNSSRVTDYCILEDTNNSDNCTWKPVNGVKEISEEYTFTTPVIKTFYAYLRNSKGISIPKVASIEYKKASQSGGDIATNPPAETTDGGGAVTGVAQDELEMRYYGKNPPNYICFGTTNKTECTSTSGQGKYMYRIIGVTKDKGKGRMFKLIKKEALDTAYYWDNVNNQDIKWNQSDLYKGLNGISGGKYTNLFIGNTTYMPDGWSNKIEDVNWKYGDFMNQNQAPATILQTEQGWTTTVTAKIGLMYVADYYYGVTKTGLNCAASANRTTCRNNNWMHFLNNDSSAPNTSYERTMSRYGLNGSYYYYAWYVVSDGVVGINALDTTDSVRPVFYLKSDIAINGTGTQSDPYIIVN